MTKRRNRGAVLGLVVTLSFVLVLIILGLFVLTMYMGGSRETRNATDAGALNVGKQMMVRVKEKPQGGTAETQFDELKDKHGEFGLGNINRVWAKAMLVCANYQAMSSEGTGGGTANSHADSIYNSAKAISDRLATKLNKPDNLYPFFEEVAERNSVRMIGRNSELRAHDPGHWKTSLVDRGVESNVMISEGQLPNGISVPKKSVDGTQYLTGYETFNIGNRPFTFVPFKVKERTHLIAGSYFNDNTKTTKPINWNNPVPNGYSVDSKSIKQDSMAHQSLAFVQPNPQKYYNLNTRGFIRINFPGNDMQYIINGLPTRTSDYGNKMGTDTQIFKGEVGTGTLTVTTSVGNEYVPPSVGLVMFNPAIPGNWDSSFRRLLQRCRELKHDCTLYEMIGVLNACPFNSTEDNYLIFPGPDGKLLCLPENAAQATSGGWLNKDAQPDGTEQNVVQEYMSMAPNFVKTAAAIPDPYCSCEPAPPVSLTFVQGWHDWTPGTGYDGCLGTLKIHRKTTVSVNVVCHPL
jgi:hypothetical protein